MEEGVTHARAIARLVPVDEGTLAGSAFAIAPRLALTAYHCVGRRVGARIELQFAGGETVAASSIGGDDDGDLALLELGRAIPDGLQPIALAATSVLADGARFLAEGFGVDSPPGSAPHAVDGTVVRADARLFERLVPALQLSSPQLAAGEDPHRFSGGPVMVDLGQRAYPPGYAAVGVVRWARVRDETPNEAIGGVFYATPVTHAARKWPQVADLTTQGVVNTGGTRVRAAGHPGSALEKITLRDRPRVRARRRPVVVRPPAFPRHLDRLEESARLLDGAAKERTLNVYGEAGVGKTYLLVAVANGDAWRKGAGSVVYVMARGMQVGDVLQKVFEELYVCDPETRFPPDLVKRLLARRAALVLVDSAELSSEQARELTQVLGTHQVVVASREHVLWDGPALALAGLPQHDAVAVIEQELGHPLDVDERRSADRICAALGGHPLHLREAMALVVERRADLATIARQLIAAPNAVAQVMELVGGEIDALSPAQCRVLAALSLLDGVTLGTDSVGALAGVPDVEALLKPLERLGLVSRHSPRWSAAPSLTSEDLGPLREWRKEARSNLVHSLLSWAETHRATPTELLVELSALLVALRLAHNDEMLAETIRLGRAIEPALVLSRRWDSWEQALLRVRDAAERLGDDATSAWALHELGTRLVAIGQRQKGIEALRQAQQLRAKLGDEPGGAVTAHNLSVAAKPASLLSRILARWLPTVSLAFIAAILMAVVLACGVAAALAIGNSSNSAQSTPTTTPPTCPAGQTGTPPNCTPTRTCPTGQTGTPPNCTPTRTCPTGQTGTPPNCTPTRTCPTGQTGTPPNCTPTRTCPTGQTGTPPNCTPTRTCPTGQTGTPPNCTPTQTCPTGQTGTPPNCTPTPTCPYGGTPPNCLTGSAGAGPAVPPRRQRGSRPQPLSPVRARTAISAHEFSTSGDRILTRAAGRNPVGYFGNARD